MVKSGVRLLAGFGGLALKFRDDFSGDQDATVCKAQPGIRTLQEHMGVMEVIPHNAK